MAITKYKRMAFLTTQGFVDVLVLYSDTDVIAGSDYNVVLTEDITISLTYTSTSKCFFPKTNGTGTNIVDTNIGWRLSTANVLQIYQNGTSLRGWSQGSNPTIHVIAIGPNNTACYNLVTVNYAGATYTVKSEPTLNVLGSITIKSGSTIGTNAASIDACYTIGELLRPYLQDIYAPTDPYAEGGTSAPGGGSGTFDGSSSNIGLPVSVPSAGALNSGFIKVFNPSAANISALAAYLWGTFDISSFKSIYNNPIDCIIALLVVPVTPTVGAAATISLGNIATNVSAPVVSDQFVIFDCGSLNIQEYWGAYLDYDPYTKVEIYLPYIGVRDIDVNDIQAKTIQLKYYIDVLSGTCVAMLQCGPDVLYSWSGQCAAEIPITSADFGSAFQTALSAGNAIGETIVNAMSGIPQNISQVASSVFNGARSKVHKSGSLGSMAGHMGIQTPYLILTRPQQSVPDDLNNLTGYPSNITATLSDLEGYTEIDVIYPENIPATSAEMDEIEQLLKDGVIL